MWIHCDADRYSGSDALRAAANDVEWSLDLVSDIDYALNISILTAEWYNHGTHIVISLRDYDSDVAGNLPDGWRIGLPPKRRVTRSRR